MSEAGRKSEPYVRLNDQRQLGELARRQHGVFTLAQLVNFGLGARAVQQRADCGRLHRVHRGVYTLVPPELLSRRGRYMAAVLACGPGAVLSHRSAAALHELRATDGAGIDVTIPGRAVRNRPRIVVHRSLTLTTADITTVDGIPCTTIARTLLDLARVLRRRSVERAVEQAEILEALDRRELVAQLERNRSTRAACRLRAVVGHLDPNVAPTESELEEAFLALCRTAGFPMPERQAYITPGDGEPAIRVDFAWRAHRLVVETDGGKYHRTRRAFESDRRRDQRLMLAGWRVVRVTWRQLQHERERITATIAGILRPA